MIVTLITKERINSITLPEKVGGQYWLTDIDATKLIGIEGTDGQWILKSNKNVKILDVEERHVKSAILFPLFIYNLFVEEGQYKALLYIEPITDDRQIFTKFTGYGEINISIGRAENNGIVIKNNFVSAVHAHILLHNEQWTIVDNDSTNGTFVNGVRVANAVLNIGDVIYIMGIKIIVGSCFIALNNPDRQVVINTNLLHIFVNQAIETKDEDEYELEEIEYFYRSPRFKRDVEKAKFKIDSPPQNAIGDEMPIMFAIGPSMTMGMASMTTAIFSINTAIANGNIASAIPSIAMSSSMLLGTVMWPIITKKYEKKRKRKKEALRQVKYKAYLDKFEISFSEECEKQQEILRENFVPITECENRIKNIQRNLWERGSGQNDFLKLRVGLGNGILDAEISYGERRFTIDDDNLQEELFTLCEKPKELIDIPITLSLVNDYVSGVIGKRKQTVEFAKGLIFQIASLYGYDEVKMVFIYDEKEKEDFEFVKWLPHVWDDDKKFRFIATNGNELKEVSAYVGREIDYRKNVNDEDIDDIAPYYIIFAMSRDLSVRAEMIDQILHEKKSLKISVISFYDELKNLPKECTLVVDLDGRVGKLYDKNDISGKHILFTPDIYLSENPRSLSTKLANVQLDVLANSYKLPQMITFLEMFGVGKVEHLNALSRWKENDPTKSLETPVGVDTMNELFKLDLHEKFHGPHGLVAGMTGSGKSEFIITYILSLAVSYHPYEVAFILIDYKGGGMAKSFENLPIQQVLLLILMAQQ